MSVPSIPILFKRPDALDSSLLFFWDAPTSDGGSPITSYILSDGINTYPITSNFGVYRLTGLTNGQSYSFTLAASNANGLGVADSFRTVQPGVVPNPPTNPSYTSAGGLSYTISWSNPSNTGNASLLGTCLTGVPLDSSGNLLSNSTNLFIRQSVIGVNSSSGVIHLNSSNNWKVSVRSVNDPGYSIDNVYTSTIFTMTGGSLNFNGSINTWLSVANDADFRFGTGDFTVEWFQYQTSLGSFPRIFSIGTYSSASIAVSIEGGSFYFWAGGSAIFSQSVTILNEWVHFAITRSGTSLRIFRNGTQLGATINNSTNFNDTTNALTIGNETTKSSGAAYQGLLTNFRWIKGAAVYTSNFPTPTTPLTATANTKLLLLASESGSATTDSSGLAKTVTNNGNNVAWSITSPF